MMTDPTMQTTLPVFTLGNVDKKLFQINAKDGNQYILEVDLPLRLMAVMMEHGTDLANNQIKTEAIDDLVTGMTQMFTRRQPEMTRKQVTDLLTVDDLIQLLQIVFGLMRGGATAPQEAAAPPAVRAGKATTTKPARSKKSTGAANSAPASTRHKSPDQPKITQDWPPQPE